LHFFVFIKKKSFIFYMSFTDTLDHLNTRSFSSSLTYPFSNNNLATQSFITELALHTIIEDDDLALIARAYSPRPSPSPATVKSGAPTPMVQREEEEEDYPDCRVDDECASDIEKTPAAQVPRFSIPPPIVTEEDIICSDIDAIQRLSLNNFFLEQSGCLVHAGDMSYAYTLLREANYPLSNRVTILRNWTEMDHMIEFSNPYLGKGGIKTVFCSTTHFQADLEKIAGRLTIKNVLAVPPAERKDYARAELLGRTRINEETQRNIAKTCAKHPDISSGPIVAHRDDAGKRMLSLLSSRTQTNLSQLAQQRQVSTQDVILRAKEIAEQLQFLHSEGIAHRDLKLENIFVDTKAHIADFDFSEFLHNGASIPPARVGRGSAPYHSPELAKAVLTGEPLSDEKTFASDIFAFGMLLFELHFVYSSKENPQKNIFYREFAFDVRTHAGKKEYLETVSNLDVFYHMRYPEPASFDSLEHLIWRMMNPFFHMRPNSREVVRALAKL
jgi:hypothetical protein